MLKQKKVLILTEGVIPYLSEDEVGMLATDLRNQSSFIFWITEYHSKEMYRHLNNKRKNREMKNSPFLFFPLNWIHFFNERDWGEQKIVYLAERAEELGRPFPQLFLG